MASIPIQIVVEIFLNPDDLEIRLQRLGDNDAYVFHITRGPRERYKNIVRNNVPLARTAAIQKIEEILEEVRNRGEESVQIKEGTLVLNSLIIRKILKEIKNLGAVSTHTLEMPKHAYRQARN